MVGERLGNQIPNDSSIMAAGFSSEGSDKAPHGVCQAAWDLVWTPVVGFDAVSGRAVAANRAASELGYSPADLLALDATRLLPEFPWREYVGKSEPCAWQGLMRDGAGNCRAAECRVQSLEDAGARLLLVAIDCRPASLDAAAGRATVDPLTGLPDRTAIALRLARAMRRACEKPGLHGALLFIDLDDFKIVNDRWGHLTGDRVLCEVARRLRTAVRPTDLAARLGGDEFVVVLEGLHDPHDAEVVARRILEHFSAPIIEEGRSFVIPASIGIAGIVCGYDRPEAILREADRAMYDAKRRGGATWQVAATRIV